MSSTSSDAHPTPADLTRVIVRPLASPLPIAFFALTIASIVYSCLQLGIIGADEAKITIIEIAVFATPVQLLASVLSFQTREPLVATGVGLIAVQWSVAAVALVGAPGGKTTSTSLGVLQIALAGVITLLVVAAATAKPLLALGLGAAAARFLMTGIYECSRSATLEHASGYVGFVVAGIAAYTALALGLEDVRHHTVLPTLRRGEAKEAFNGDLAFQLGSVATEAGVRRQL